jgi:hypothetical protein
MTRRLIASIVVMVGLLAATTADARPIALAWDASTDAVSGYVIFFGTRAGEYPNSVDVGNLLSYQLDLPGDQYYFVVCAYDAAGNTSPSSNEVAESSLITLTNPGDQTDGAGAFVNLQLGASGSPVSYTAAPLPSGLAINPSTGVISGTIDSGAAASSPYVVRAAASNANGNTSSVQFTWTIAGVNRPPTVSPPADQTAVAGSAATLAIAAADPDGDTLTFSAVNLPAGLTIDAASGAISGTIAAGAAGTYRVTVSASDGSLTGSSAFTWTVTGGVNHAPMLTQPADQTSAEDTTVALQLAASDPDGEALTYGATGLPAGLTVDAATGRISGTLTFISTGTYSVTAIVSDGKVAATASFTWTVTNVDRAPSVTTPADRTSTENEAVSLQVAASDPDGDTLTYTATGLPPALSIDAATGLISGTLSSTSAGSYAVTVQASDGILSSSATFTWSVATANQPPTMVSPGNQSSRVGAAVSLAIVASDANGDALTFLATGLPGTLSIDRRTGVIGGTVVALPGSYSVTVSVSDGQAVVSRNFPWAVTLL